MNLFKSYCCSFYGSILWKFNSVGFDKICKSWNTVIRTLLHLPYNTHTCYLGPLIDQLHIRRQLYIRDCCFLWHASRLSNCIVKICINNASYTANTCIGYKLSFYRNVYYLDMCSNLKLSVARLSIDTLDQNQHVISNLMTLLNVRSGHNVINNLHYDQVDILINYLSTT